TSLWILISFERLRQLLNDLNQLASLPLIFGDDVRQTDQRHPVPTKGTPPMKSRSVRSRIRPRLRAAFIVRMPQVSRRGIVEMLVIDQHLLHHFFVGVFAFAKHLAVARKKRQRHKDAIGPQLPGTARNVRMPEAAVIRARIAVEYFANVLRRELVLFLL